MCAYAFNCCWLLCVLSLFFFSSNPSAATICLLLAIPHAPTILWVAPAPGLRRPAPDRPPLPCVFGKSKKKEREKHNRVRDFWSRRRPHPFFFCFGSHLPVHRLCISFSKFKTKKRDLPNPDRLQLRKFWSPWQSYHTKGRPDLLVTGIPLPFLKSVCGNLLICIPLLI